MGMMQDSVSDAAARHIDHAQKGGLVTGVGAYFKIRYDVLHLRALEKVLAADDHIGDARLAKGQFKGTGLNIRPVQ